MSGQTAPVSQSFLRKVREFVTATKKVRASLRKI